MAAPHVDMQGKRVMITGFTSGIGEAAARALAGMGAAAGTPPADAVARPTPATLPLEESRASVRRLLALDVIRLMDDELLPLAAIAFSLDRRQRSRTCP